MALFNRTTKYGQTLLGIWMIAVGALRFIHLSNPNIGMLFAVVGIAAGILILLDR